MSDLHLSRFTAKALRDAIVQAAKEIREEFNSHDIAHMRLEISVSGRVTGDLKIVFGVDDSTYGTLVTSHDLRAALFEFNRRHGWEAENEAMLLSYSGEEKLESES